MGSRTDEKKNSLFLFKLKTQPIEECDHLEAILAP